jgi:hypothetical protein
MDPAIFDDLERTVTAQGPEAALRRLCDTLREQKDYHSLFYALLMQKRHQLGVSPIPTGPSQDLPEAVHEPYEDAIRQAGRLVGNLFLKDGDLPQAWAYFRMLGEPEPVQAALDQFQPGDNDDVQPLVQIAYYENVHPKKGFEWIIGRYGICNAITTLGTQGLPQEAAVRQHCLQALVRTLYAELRDRLTAAVAEHEGKPPAEGSEPPDTPGVIRRLMAGRDALFGEDSYHIDTSHLSSVVQMSIHLTPCLEMGLARELCAYGLRLSDRLTGMSSPPFEDQYRAFDHYLAILQGDHVEEGIAYFQAQAEKADPETVGTYPAEVLVNLLLRLERPEEALAVARKYLSATEGRQLSCPEVKELCRRLKDYRTLAEVARANGDPVHFLAGLLAARQ